MPNCPHCNQAIAYVRHEPIVLAGADQKQRIKGVAYCCPLCETIISVEPDPLALQADTVSLIVEALRGATPPG